MTKIPVRVGQILFAIIFTLFGCTNSSSPDGGDAGLPDGGDPDAGSSDSGVSSNKALTGFEFTDAANADLSADAIIIIDGTEITATVPNGTDVTALVAIFATTGVSVAVNGTPQESGTTENDFSSTVIYTVTAEDGSTRDYMVTVGNSLSYTAGFLSFTMVHMPGGVTFPISVADDTTATVDDAYYIGQTEVTYVLWYGVRDWAENTADPSYAFENNGAEGSTGDDGAVPIATGGDRQPVTSINWCDAMVWMNALTEYYNAQNGTSLTAVYTYDGSIIRDSQSTNMTACDGAVAGSTADGFRLLTTNEWELAARLITDDGDSILDKTGEYYPGNYASGADAAYNEAAGGSDFDGDGDVEYTVNVAIFGQTSGQTSPVMSKSPNAQDIYDMNGNVREWVADWSLLGGCVAMQCHAVLGGSYNTPDTWMRIGYQSSNLTATTIQALGFRLGKTDR